MNCKKLLINFLLILLTVNSCFSATKTVSLGERIYLPQIGLSLKLFKDMESRPLVLPSLYKTKLSLNEVYKSDEIWRYKQFIGEWSKSFADIIIALMGSPAGAINSSFITEGSASGRFENKSKSAAWSDNNTEKWVKLFFAPQNFSKKLTTFNLGKSCSVTLYFGEDDNCNYFLSVFAEKSRLKQNIAIMYKISNSVHKNDAAKAVFKSVKTIKYIKIEDKNSVKYLNSAAYKNSKKSSSFNKELLLSSIKNFKDWNAIEASDYFILTNCNINDKSDSFIKTVSDTLKKGELIYQRFNKKKVQTTDKFVVRIFKDRDGYVAYVGKDLQWSGGLWVPSKKELVLTKSNFTSSERKRFISVLKHEAFHQYIHYATGETLTGAWFNEGYAKFFENVSLVGNKIYIKPNKVSLDYIKGHLKDDNLSDRIEALLTKSYKEFYAKDQSRDNYSLAWAIIYYLNTGTIVTWKKFRRNYSKILPVYYRELYALKNNDNATRIAWKNINIKQFTKDFIFYFKTYVSAGKTDIIKL